MTLSTILASLTPETALQDTDPILLDSELKQLQKIHLERPKWQPDASANDETNASARRAYEDEEATLIHYQLARLAALRKTGTGPAKAGGKRGKKAQDLASIEAALGLN